MKELKKLRIEFVLVFMGIVVIFLMTIFSIQYYSSSKEYRENTVKALEIALNEKRNMRWNRENQGFGWKPEDNMAPVDGSSEEWPEEVTEGQSEGQPEEVTEGQSEGQPEEVTEGITAGPFEGQMGNNDSLMNDKMGNMMDKFGDDTSRVSILLVELIAADEADSQEAADTDVAASKEADDTGVVASGETDDTDVVASEETNETVAGDLEEANYDIQTIRNDMFYMEDTYIQEIVQATPYENEIASLTYPGEMRHGELEDYGLRFCLQKDSMDGQIYIAYADVSSAKNMLSSMLKRSILISLGVIIVMLILSIFLSRKVLRPVEKAWSDQKRFVADASHELKTPLAVIISNTDMMMKSGDRNSDKNVRRLDNIRIESERMKELVQELLEVARGDISEKELIKEEVQLSELVEEELLVWDPIYYEAGKELISEIDENIRMTGDPAKLRRLVGILVDNALKYSFDGSTVRVRLSGKSITGIHKKGDHSICLTVENEGNALTEEECSKIFERFYRADKSREKISGYGLGLSIAVSIVEEHNGTIKASSREDADSGKNIFIVTF